MENNQYTIHPTVRMSVDKMRPMWLGYQGEKNA